MWETSLTEKLAIFFSFFFLALKPFSYLFLYATMPAVVTTGADLQELVTKAKTCSILVQSMLKINH